MMERAGERVDDQVVDWIPSASDLVALINISKAEVLGGWRVDDMVDSGAIVVGAGEVEEMISLKINSVVPLNLMPDNMVVTRDANVVLDTGTGVVVGTDASSPLIPLRSASSSKTCLMVVVGSSVVVLVLVEVLELNFDSVDSEAGSSLAMDFSVAIAPTDATVDISGSTELGLFSSTELVVVISGASDELEGSSAGSFAPESASSGITVVFSSIFSVDEVTSGEIVVATDSLDVSGSTELEGNWGSLIAG